MEPDTRVGSVYLHSTRLSFVQKAQLLAALLLGLGCFMMSVSYLPTVLLKGEAVEKNYGHSFTGALVLFVVAVAFYTMRARFRVFYGTLEFFLALGFGGQ